MAMMSGFGIVLVGKSRQLSASCLRVPEFTRQTDNWRRFASGIPKLNPFESLLNLLHRITQEYRAAVRTVHRTRGSREFAEQPFHLFPVERHVHLDGRVAGDRGGDFRSERIERKRTSLGSHAVQNLDQPPFDVNA